MAIITTSLGFLIVAALLAFSLEPILTRLLYDFHLFRNFEYDSSKILPFREKSKAGTPIMGGLLVVVVVVVMTVLLNWTPVYTYVPIGVMTLAAVLGGVDDVLNIYGVPRQVRTFRKTLLLARVHKKLLMRLWHFVTLPWAAFRSVVRKFGSHPGRGIQVHEKLVLQFIAGAITAWWIFFKLGPEWREIWVPFMGELDLGFWIVPLVIFIVMFTANAVNVADGLDGLAGGTLLTAFGGLLVISWFQGNVHFAALNATVIGALLVYTYFNIKPAKFQMGDVGSLGIGALLAVMTVAQNRIVILPFLGMIFFIELLSVMVQSFSRSLLQKRIWLMTPIHHHLEALGWSEERIVARFWVLNALAVMVGLWLAMH